MQTKVFERKIISFMTDRSKAHRKAMQSELSDWIAGFTLLDHKKRTIFILCRIYFQIIPY